MSDDRQLLLWPDGDLSCAPERWIRTGECVRCGACCEDEDRPHYLVGVLENADGSPVDVDEDAVDADGEAVSAARDASSAGDGTGVDVTPGEARAEPDDDPGSDTADLPPGPVVAEAWDGQWVFWRQSGARYGPCPKWQGGGECAVYGAEDFPHVCKKWPVLPSEMENYPTCGFAFRISGGDPAS